MSNQDYAPYGRDCFGNALPPPRQQGELERIFDQVMTVIVLTLIFHAVWVAVKWTAIQLWHGIQYLHARYVQWHNKRVLGQ